MSTLHPFVSRQQTMQGIVGTWSQPRFGGNIAFEWGAVGAGASQGLGAGAGRGEEGVGLSYLLWG